MNEQRVGVIYASKSTKDPRDSIESQQKLCLAFAAEQGIEVSPDHLFKDEDESGYTKSRGDGLLDATETAKRLSVERGQCAFIVLKPNRLARGDGKQAKHLAEYSLWALQNGIDLLSAGGEPISKLGYSGPAGDASHDDSDSKSVFTRQGKRRAALERGKRNGGPRPYGYKHVRTIVDNQVESILTSVRIEAIAVARMFTEYLKGFSQSEIARRLNRDGYRTTNGRPWSQARVSAVLRNRLYCGEVQYKGEWAPGEHEPLVSHETFDAVQQRISERKWRGKRGGHPTKKNRHLMVGGLLRCSCGATMRARTNEKMDSSLYESYICDGRFGGSTTCTRSAVPREPLDSAVLAYFEHVGVNVERLREDVARLADVRLREIDGNIERADRELAERQADLASVRRDYESRDLPAKLYVESRERLSGEIEAAEAKLDQLRSSRDEIQRQADLDAVEDEIIERLIQIREEVSGAVAGTGSLPAARRALWQLFEGFVLHDQDSEDLPDLIQGDLWEPRQGWIIEPRVRPEVIAQPLILGSDGEVMHPEQLDGVGGELIASSP